MRRGVNKQMSERKKVVVYQAAAFVLLLILSLYRQLSLHFAENSRARSYIVYAGYMLLLVSWGVFIFSRVTQKNLCRLLLSEGVVMGLGLTIRFVQDAFLQGNVSLLRISGYYVCATLLPLALLGFWSSLGLGQGEDYWIPKKWYWLCVPVLALTCMLVMDDRFHVMFRVLPEEREPNVYFHPNFGLVLIVGVGVSLVIARAVVIYRRNKINPEQAGVRKWMPIAQILLMLLFLIPYLFTSFYGTPEIVEFFAGIYYLEALSWVLYILVGLVPVNMEYVSVFEYSTIGMQILNEDGSVILKSQNADELDGTQFQRLKQEGKILLPDREILLHENDGSCFVWRKDIRRIREIIDETKEMESELSHESALLQQEIRARTEEARVKAQNEIYRRLSEEVVHPLAMMRELAKKCRMFPENQEYLRILFVLGTYVKRRCNLRLIEQENGEIQTEEICLSFQSMVFALRQLGTSCEFTTLGNVRHSAEFWIFAFDQLETLIEREDFRLKHVRIALDPACVNYTVAPDAEKMRRKTAACSTPYSIKAQKFEDGYSVILKE